MQQVKSNKLKAVQLALAAAIGSAVAFPAMAQSAIGQTNVTFSGVVDAYAGSQKYSGDPASTAIVGSGGMTTSWFGFTGDEDLGGGLKADFKLTSFFTPNNGVQGRFPGDTFFSRDANVGLSGNFGKVSIGRDLAPNFLPSILFNPFGDSFQFSPLILHMDISSPSAPSDLINKANWTNTTAGDTGWSNEVIYTTPNFAGLKANLHYQFGGVAGQTGKNNIGFNALYFHGPLALTAFYQRVEINNPTNDGAGDVQPAFGITLPNGDVASRQTAWFAGASYDLTFAKLFATYQHTTQDIPLQDKTTQLGVSIPLGQGAILASWANTRRSGSDDGTVDGSSLTRNTAAIGYDYNMSKRTDLYAIYMYDKITDQDMGGSFGVGIRHHF